MFLSQFTMSDFILQIVSKAKEAGFSPDDINLLIAKKEERYKQERERDKQEKEREERREERELRKLEL